MIGRLALAAVLGSVVSATYQGRLAELFVSTEGLDTLGNLVETARHLPESAAGALLVEGREAFVAGMHGASAATAVRVTAWTARA